MLKFLPFLIIVFSALTFITSCKQKADNEKPKIEHKEKTTKKQSDNSQKTKEKTTVIADYDTTKWKEIKAPDFNLDLRYATKNNFVKEKLYNCGRCFVRPEVYTNLVKANEELKTMGYKFKLYDCYRPKPFQQKLWDIKPDPNYVTDPKKGSMHNRGLALDISIVDENNVELDMGTEFDYFGKEAHHDYTDLPANVLANRHLLRTIMEKYGFNGIRTEWWHYSMRKLNYPISDWVWECN
ncbi:MAG: M15 family metallopeptidase [Saprospiraceae bacterium]